jgi:hypothetical protein
MIRTLIEITSETTWDHNSQLRDTLDKLGFEPKPGADHVRFMNDLWRELADRGLDPQKLVEAQREKRDAA